MKMGNKQQGGVKFSTASDAPLNGSRRDYSSGTVANYGSGANNNKSIKDPNRVLSPSFSSSAMSSTAVHNNRHRQSTVGMLQRAESTATSTVLDHGPPANASGSGPTVVALNRRCSELRPMMSITTTSGMSGSTEAMTDRLQINGLKPLDPNRQSSRRRWSSAATINARNVMKPKRLLPRQCHLIIKSWNKKVPKSRVARDIFSAIFSEAEELKPIFGISPGTRGKKLRTDPKFVSHTSLFADTLDFAVRNLDDISLVTENAEQLGRRHAAIFHLQPDNFRAEYWGMFTECIIENVVGTAEDKETQLAWRQFIHTLVFYMKLGYEREALRVARNASMRRATLKQKQPELDQDDA